ncbi:hypothetical protein ACVW19_002227 [Streptomyces sp. TE5632]
MRRWAEELDAEGTARMGRIQIFGGMNTFAAVPVGWPRGRFGPVSRRLVEGVVRRNRVVIRRSAVMPWTSAGPLPLGGEQQVP